MSIKEMRKNWMRKWGNDKINETTRGISPRCEDMNLARATWKLLDMGCIHIVHFPFLGGNNLHHPTPDLIRCYGKPNLVQNRSIHEVSYMSAKGPGGSYSVDVWPIRWIFTRLNPWESNPSVTCQDFSPAKSNIPAVGLLVSPHTTGSSPSPQAFWYEYQGTSKIWLRPVM